MMLPTVHGHGHGVGDLKDSWKSPLMRQDMVQNGYVTG